jgi:ABC-2 type transport system permease protein/lipopolysaccharide transport system permease protein
MTVISIPVETSAAVQTKAIVDTPLPRVEQARESYGAFLVRVFKELQCVKFALASFIVNNLRRRYRRSVLGFAWSLLNPLFTMMVMTAVFSLLFHRDPRAFSVFLFTGLLPWTFINDAIINGSQSIVAAEPFLKKVYIPKVFFPLVTVGTEGVNFCLSLVSMIALGLCLGMHVGWSLLLAPLSIILLSLFTFSLALSLSVATVYFRDLTHIIKIILGAAFYLVPVLYPLEQIPNQFRGFFLLNPIYYFIDLFRITINQCRVPTLNEWATPLALTIGCLVVCMYVVMKTEKDLIYRL